MLYAPAVRVNVSSQALALLAEIEPAYICNKYVAIILSTTNMLYNCAKSNKKQGTMKYSEFRRWLEQQGVTFTPGKGSHRKISLNGKFSVFPDHGTRRILA